MGLAQSMGFKPTLPPQYQQKDYLLMTYRSGIVPVQKTTYYTSDSGWGCMLRVAQMFIANLLEREQYHVSKQAIIRLFYDNLMVPFSIQMMTKVSVQLFPHMKPYAWYTPCQAGFLVKDLLQLFDTRYKVVICNDGAMFLEDILKIEDDNLKTDDLKGKTSNQNKNQTLDKQKILENVNENHKLQNSEQLSQKPSINHSQQSKSKPQLQQHPYLQQRIVVLLMARIGLDSPQPGYIKCITKLMQNKYFLSIMGGTPKHAHLFMQYFDGYFGFLDPHTTRPVVKDYSKVSQYIDQYTSKLIWINQRKIDSSMCVGFCFFKSQIQQFWQSMQQLKNQLKQDFFIYLDLQRPQFDQNAIIEIGGYSDQEQEDQKEEQQG